MAKHHRKDPVAEVAADRAAPTMAALAARYRESHLPKKRPSSQSADEMMLDKIILPAMRNKRVAEMDYRDVDDLHRKITKAGSPIRANRVVALLSKMFSLAARW
ncbi:MAG: phage integrase central domain-containing protein, partial [Rhizomicrobium sp.]